MEFLLVAPIQIANSSGHDPRVALQQHLDVYRRNLYWMNDDEFENHCQRDHKVLRDINIYALFIFVGTAAIAFIVYYIVSTANPSLQLQ
jgi:hypothetical protein